MRIEHVTINPDGTAMILIPRSKGDAAGNGRVAYLSPNTTSLLKGWLGEAALRKGPLFRSLHLGRFSQQSLDTSSIRRLITRATKRTGLDLSNRLSGHSMRVGAAQDMMVAGFDALAIMQAGGWKSANVLLRYVENAATKELHVRRWNLIQLKL
jgi:integrase/recombinase XerD